MDKAITILPNFTVIVNRKHPGEKSNNFTGCIGIHATDVSRGEDVAVFKITPKSFWQGTNREALGSRLEENGRLLILDYLKEHSNPIPENVWTELTSWMSKRDRIVIIGDDCIRIKEKDLLAQVLNNSKIKEHIYRSEDDLIFFQNTDYARFNDLFIQELGFPITIHHPKVFFHAIQLKSRATYVMKASTPELALRYFYNLTHVCNEETLKARLKINREVKEEDILKYLELFKIEDVTRIQLLARGTWFYETRKVAEELKAKDIASFLLKEKV